MSLIFTIIAAYCFWIVGKVILKIARQRRCPPEEMINDFFRGRINKKEPYYEYMTTHLGLCEKCKDKMHDLS